MMREDGPGWARWLADPPWGRVWLPAGLVQGEVDPHWPSTMVGCLYAIAAHGPPALPVLEAVGNDDDAWRAGLARARRIRGVEDRMRRGWAWHAATFIACRQERNATFEEAARAWMTVHERLGGPSEAAVARTLEAWRAAQSATHRLLATVAWSEHPLADDWLTWTHRAELRGRTAGRGLWMMAYLMLLAGRPDAIHRVKALDRALLLREWAPQDWWTIVDALVHRAALYEAGGEQLDLRRVPLVRLVSSWMTVSGRPERASLAAHLRAFTAELSVSTQGRAGFALAPIRRLGEAGEAIALPKAMKEEHSALGAIRDAGAHARVAAALTFVLNRDAENFATRQMPSAKLWASFSVLLRGRVCAAEGDGCLLPCAGRSARTCAATRPDAHRTPLAVYDLNHRPWTVAALFNVAMETLVRGDERGLRSTRFSAPPGLSERAAAIPGAIRSWLASLRPAQRETIIRREVRLRADRA